MESGKKIIEMKTLFKLKLFLIPAVCVRPESARRLISLNVVWEQCCEKIEENSNILGGLSTTAT